MQCTLESTSRHVLFNIVLVEELLRRSKIDLLCVRIEYDGCQPQYYLGVWPNHT